MLNQNNIDSKNESLSEITIYFKPLNVSYWTDHMHCTLRLDGKFDFRKATYTKYKKYYYAPLR